MFFSCNRRNIAVRVSIGVDAASPVGESDSAVGTAAVRIAAHWWRAGQKAFAVALVGLCTNLASPLSWTHHYVWALPMGAAVVLSGGLPKWVRSIGGFWVIWVCACLPLAVLPYAGARERNFSFLQQVVANLGPVLGTVLVVGLAWQLVVEARRESAPLRTFVSVG